MEPELKVVLKEIVELLKGIREDQNKTLKLLSKYDDAYLTEVASGQHFVEG